MRRKGLGDEMAYILFYLPILVHFVLMKMKRSGIVDVEL